MYNSNPPEETAKLIFIHHSCGGNWLRDENGGLGIELMANNYHVSDTNYGWGPDSIGDKTDTGDWWTWFRGEKSKTYMDAVYEENQAHTGYSRFQETPVGENEIIMFKSCYPNSNYKGNPDESMPSILENPLRGWNCNSEFHTISNAKGIYTDLLEYFITRQDKLFIAVTAPPVSSSEYSMNCRNFNNWLVNSWLKDYPYKNVAVFDLYNVLTSNGGSPDINDLDMDTGNHHCLKNGAIRHITGVSSDTGKYPVKEGNDHPSRAGNIKATKEFIKLLNVYYNEWKNTIR